MISELGEVYETFFGESDVDKCTEVGEIGDDSFESHPVMKVCKSIEERVLDILTKALGGLSKGVLGRLDIFEDGDFIFEDLLKELGIEEVVIFGESKLERVEKAPLFDGL